MKGATTGGKPQGHERIASEQQTWEIAPVKTLKVDDQKRIRLPDAKPRQVFAYENKGDGTLILTPVNATTKEAFPPGSLARYVTPESDKEMLTLLNGCSLEAPA